MIFVRYTVVQVAAYCIDMGGFLLLWKMFDAGPIMANLGGKIAAGSFAFVAHRHVTFRSAGSGSMVGQGVRYLALLLLNIPLSSGVLAVVLMVVSNAIIGKLISDVICVAFTYWVSKSHVFTRRTKAHGNGVDVGRENT